MRLRNAPVRITLVDRRNFHLFQPLLYQVATGALSPANISAPLRSILKRQRNLTVYLADAVGVDVEAKRLRLEEGSISYDTLIVATGAHHQYFGNDAWSSIAPGLKTVEDAINIRHRVLRAFEAAERETNPDEVERLLTFVIVGAGPTGVELAGALCEIARHTLNNEFRHITPSDARVLLLDLAERVLPSYPPDLSAKAEKTLVRLGVTVRTSVKVTDIKSHMVSILDDGVAEQIPASTVLWAAGVEASHLGKMIAAKTGAALDSAERLIVRPDLTVPKHPEIFVVGDLAHCKNPGAKQPLPGVAPVAIQQGAYAARAIQLRMNGKKPKPFHYRDFGSMATIGRSSAVAKIGCLHLSGMPAWLAWLFIHLLNIVEFQNRILVLTQWAWNYFTWSRAARLITGEPPLHFQHKRNQ
jgi:NADH dehydrogenase